MNQPPRSLDALELTLRKRATLTTEEKLLDSLIPPPPPNYSTFGVTAEDYMKHYRHLRGLVLNHLRSGKLDERVIDVKSEVPLAEVRVKIDKELLDEAVASLENEFGVSVPKSISDLLADVLRSGVKLEALLALGGKDSFDRLQISEALGLNRFRTEKMPVAKARQQLFKTEYRILRTLLEVEEDQYSLPSSQETIEIVQAGFLKFLRSDPEAIFRMTHRQFEEMILEILIKLGFHADLTIPTRDGGCDVIAVRKDSLGITTKYIVEAKHYKPPHKVGVGIVRQLNTVRMRERGHHGILVTSSYFTADAVAENRCYYRLHLKDYDSLLEWIDVPQKARKPGFIHLNNLPPGWDR